MGFLAIAGRAIGSSQHDLADELLERRAVGELDGEMIEQRATPRSCAELAEIIGSFDDSAAKKLEPHTIGERSPKVRLIRTRDCMGERETAAARNCGRWRDRRNRSVENRQLCARRNFSVIAR